MGKDVVRVCGAEPEKMTELRRDVVATFVFGMAYAASQVAQLTAPEAHALALLLLRDVFHFDDQNAARVADTAIRASIDPSYHDTVNAIIHQGIEGHREWVEGRHAELQARVEHVLNAVGA